MSASNATRTAYRLCTEISARCPVEKTVLGYYPNFGANIFFAVGFGLCFLATVGVGTWKRTWSFTIAIAFGCVLEMVGYVARALLNSNPWNKNAFQTQIVAIILSPTILCVGIYLTLKHISLNLSPELSRLRPRLYPWVFLPADASCLIVQAIGGGIAAAAGSDGQNKKLLDGGNRAIIAGIALQVVVLLGFGLLSLEYYLRVRRWIKTPEATPQALALWNDRKFRLFGYAVSGAFAGILIRCIYRIAEMAGGWGNHIMQDEPSFIVLDGCMVLIAVSLLSIFPPGIYFPQMAAKRNAETAEPAVEATSTAPTEELKAADSS